MTGKNRIMIYGPKEDGTTSSSSEWQTATRYQSRSLKTKPQ
jgi:hypothetical protein